MGRLGITVERGRRRLRSPSTFEVGHFRPGWEACVCGSMGTQYRCKSRPRGVGGFRRLMYHSGIVVGACPATALKPVYVRRWTLRVMVQVLQWAACVCSSIHGAQYHCESAFLASEDSIASAASGGYVHCRRRSGYLPSGPRGRGLVTLFLGSSWNLGHFCFDLVLGIS